MTPMLLHSANTKREAKAIARDAREPRGATVWLRRVSARWRVYAGGSPVQVKRALTLTEWLPW